MRRENVDSDCVITLVHGTWARNTLWAKKGSELYELLAAHYGEQCIKRFKWSGSNSHRARLKAGKRLAQVLRNNINSRPSAKHFVVSHSHGGNVTLYALRDENLRKHLSGLMFMGVPFIHCGARDIDEALGLVPHILSFLISGLLGLTVIIASLLAFFVFNLPADLIVIKFTFCVTVLVLIFILIVFEDDLKELAKQKKTKTRQMGSVSAG